MANARKDILGFAVDTRNASSCVVDVLESIRRKTVAGRCQWLACLNPHSYTMAMSDTKFKQALKNADWLVADGIGIVLAAKILRRGLMGRVTGSDIFWGLHKEMNAAGGMSVYFFGSTDENLQLICERMARDYPRIGVAGAFSPPFKSSYSTQETDAMIHDINSASADVLWVGMTAPKQEKWIYENHRRLNVKFAGAVGAVFDFYSGSVKRSHPLFQRLGLEWLPRLLQQPRRLWTRMFVSAPIFLWHVARDLFRWR